jgi:hypothetical protein
LIPPQGGTGVLADIDRSINGRDEGSSNRRKTTGAPVMVKKPSSKTNEDDDSSEGYDASQEYANRANNLR